MAEQRVLEHRVAQRAHVERDETTRAPALLVQERRDELLSRPGLTLDQHGKTRRRDRGDRAHAARCIGAESADERGVVESTRVTARTCVRALAQRRR